ncbi:MAG: GNAT family N-acetyltransferase [Myxococcales bacterium]|nr:GNAT family N-acetyltransferase [Myxococcales bacterium]
MSIRKVEPRDEPAIHDLLARHADSSMFLRSNLLAGGLVDHGAVYQGTWVAAFEGELAVGTAAHCWNGMLLLQAPTYTETLARAALRATASGGRKLSGLAGPLEQVRIVVDALGLAASISTMSEERLYAIELDDMVVPTSLDEGRLRCRRSREGDIELCARWRAAFLVEALGANAGPALLARATHEVEQAHVRRELFVLEDPSGAPLASSAFNARLPDIAQVGGVYTPPEHRSRGHGRAVVAGSLVIARQDGVRRAVLFTGRGNQPAQRAYEALGFAPVGTFGLCLLSSPA